MFLISLLAVLAIAPPPPNPTNSIVLLRNLDSVCTGVVIRPTQVLSAEHCVTNPDMLTVDGLPAKVIKKSETLLLIDVPGLIKPGIEVGKLPERGAQVRSWGFAYNLGLTVMVRHIANFLGPDLMLDGPIAGGMSGGPVLDANGKLVGINQATEKVNFASSIACGPVEIREFLGGK